MFAPRILALALLALYAGFFVVTPVREFFELTPMSWSDVALIGALAIAWSLLVMLFWRLRLVDRHLCLEEERAQPRLSSPGIRRRQACAQLGLGIRDACQDLVAHAVEDWSRLRQRRDRLT